LTEICIKCVIFIEKLQKIAPKLPMAFGGNLPFALLLPPLRNPGYATAFTDMTKQ